MGSLMNNEHQRAVKLFKPTTSPKQTPTAHSPCDKYAYVNKQDLAVTVAVAPGKASKDYVLDTMDEQERRKLRKRLQNREAARRLKIRKKLELEELQDKVNAISSATSKLRKKIMRTSEECSLLKSENKALLEELRDVCDQETIYKLEEMNPCREQSDNEPDNSSQNQEASYESGQDTDDSSNSDEIADSPDG